MKKKTIKCLVAPANPNLDKLTMIWLLLRFGAGTSLELDPNFAIAEFTSGLLPQGKTADGLEEKGHLFLDCGGGRFDGHGRAKLDRCSGTKLIAKALDLQQNPLVKYLVATVDRQDLQGRRRWDEIASVIVNGYRVGRKPEDMRRWVFAALDAVVACNDRILSGGGQVKTKGKSHHSLQIPNVAKIFDDEEEGKQWSDWGDEVIRNSKTLQTQGKEIAEKYMAKELIGHDKFGDIKLALSRSEGNPTVLGNLHYLGADVAMARYTPKGSEHTTYCISVSKDARERGITLYKVIANLRLAEAQKLGVTLDPASLSCVGTHPLIEAWHLHEGIGGTRVYNRTEQHQTITGTLLNYQELLDCVMFGLEGRSVPPPRKKKPQRQRDQTRNRQQKKKQHQPRKQSRLKNPVIQ